MGPHLIRLIILWPHSISYNPPDSITVMRESPRRWLVPADLKSESGLPVAGRSPKTLESAFSAPRHLTWSMSFHLSTPGETLEGSALPYTTNPLQFCDL